MAGTAAKQFIGAILLIIAACTNVRSATIQETDNKLCAFRLEGVISSGDSETFSQLIRRNLSRMHELDSRTRTLCLKSVGGSYFEALRISELVYDRGISTLIEYGSQCFSACAVIFMAGVTSDRNGPIMPYRQLSAGGLLGFHAPFVSLPDEKYSKQQVEDVAQSMRKAILALVELSGLHPVWMTPA